MSTVPTSTKAIRKSERKAKSNGVLQAVSSNSNTKSLDGITSRTSSHRRHSPTSVVGGFGNPSKFSWESYNDLSEPLPIKQSSLATAVTITNSSPSSYLLCNEQLPPEGDNSCYPSHLNGSLFCKNNKPIEIPRFYHQCLFYRNSLINNDIPPLVKERYDPILFPVKKQNDHPNIEEWKTTEAQPVVANSFPPNKINPPVEENIEDQVNENDGDEEEEEYPMINLSRENSEDLTVIRPPFYGGGSTTASTSTSLLLSAFSKALSPLMMRSRTSLIGVTDIDDKILPPSPDKAHNEPIEASSSSLLMKGVQECRGDISRVLLLSPPSELPLPPPFLERGESYLYSPIPLRYMLGRFSSNENATSTTTAQPRVVRFADHDDITFISPSSSNAKMTAPPPSILGKKSSHNTSPIKTATTTTSTCYSSPVAVNEQSKKRHIAKKKTMVSTEPQDSKKRKTSNRHNNRGPITKRKSTSVASPTTTTTTATNSETTCIGPTKTRPPPGSSLGSKSIVPIKVPPPLSSASRGMSNGGLSKGQTENWSKRYQELREFVQQNGHSSVPNSYPPNEKLANWCKRQRHQFKLYASGKVNESSMNPQRIALLDCLNFAWDMREAKWRTKFHQMKKFLLAAQNSKGAKSNGNAYCIVGPPNEKELLCWCKAQRTQYRLFQSGQRTQLTAERIQRLKSIGFSFETPTKQKKHDI